MNWDDAACKGYSDDKDYDAFFPTIVDEDGNEHFDDGTIWEAFGDTAPYYREAKEICDRCPIKQECYQHALDHKERWGMWGGSIPIERRRVERRARRLKRRQREAAELAEKNS